MYLAKLEIEIASVLFETITQQLLAQRSSLHLFGPLHLSLPSLMMLLLLSENGKEYRLCITNSKK